MIKKTYFKNVKNKDFCVSTQIASHLTKEISENNCKNITFGCSHTWGYGIEENHTWPALLKKEGISFINAARPGSCLCSLSHYEIPLLREMLNFKNIQHIVLQSPICLRHPWDNKNDVKSSIKIINFFKLNRKIQFLILNKIFDEESILLKSFVSLFPNSKFAYWKYWIDYPPLIRYNDKLEKQAMKLGMESFRFIVLSKNLKDVAINKYGWIKNKQEKIFKKGWIVGLDDYHPTQKHNELIAEKVLKWLS